IVGLLDEPAGFPCATTTEAANRRKIVGVHRPVPLPCVMPIETPYRVAFTVVRDEVIGLFSRPCQPPFQQRSVIAHTSVYMFPFCSNQSRRRRSAFGTERRERRQERDR